MGKIRTDALFIAIVAVILLPTIFFPISADISIYALGGKTIAEGGKIYSDFLDLKPPFIFYIFSLIYKTIGISEIALRLLDFSLQFIVSYLIYRLTSKIFQNRSIGLFSAIVYSSLYSSLSFCQTLNPESFAGVIIVLSIYTYFNQKITNIVKYMILGMLCGMLAGLKYSMALLPFAFIIFDIAISKVRFMTLIKNYAIMFAGFTIVFLLTLMPLLDSAIFADYKEALRYLSFHSSHPPLNSEFVKDALKTIAVYFGDNYSISFVIFFAIGLSFFNPKEVKNSESKTEFLYITLIIAIMMFFSVAIERKFSIYHFSRFYAPMAIFTGIGMGAFFASIKDFTFKSKFNAALSVFCFLLLALFSPAPRIINNYITTAYYFTNVDKYNKFYQRDDSQNIRITYLRVAEKINSEIKDNSLVMVMAIGGSQINYFIENARISKFSQSLFYFGIFQSAKWERDFENELKSAKLIAVQTNDIHPALTRHNKSSFQLLQESGLAEYFSHHFVLADTIDCFKIYKRK